MEFERELNEALAKNLQSDAGETATSVISQRLTILLALAVLILPCGLLIVVGVWIYRHVRALLRPPKPDAAFSDQHSAVTLKQDALADS